MNHEVAESAIDMLIKESAERPAVHVTFFGGETLMNFPLLRSSVDYAKTKCAEAGKKVEFSLTTNATLLNEEIVDFLSEHRIGVTVSMDGDRELNDKMRVFHDGRGSYDVIVPKIQDASGAAPDQLHRRSRDVERRRSACARAFMTISRRKSGSARWVLAGHRQPGPAVSHRSTENGQRAGRFRRTGLAIPRLCHCEASSTASPTPTTR